MRPSGKSPDSVRQMVRIHALLKEANAEHLQGNYRAAVAKCEDALAIDGNSADALDMLGDVHAGAAHFKAAMEAYKKALKADPSRAAVEEKLGRASIGQYRFDRQIEYGRRLLDGGGTKKDIRKASQTATALSILLPGAGQVLNQHFGKATVMIAIHLLALFLLLNVFSDAIAAASEADQVSGRETVGFSKGISNAMNVLKRQGRAWQVYALIVIDLGVWGWSIIDAGVCATRREEEDYV